MVNETRQGRRCMINGNRLDIWGILMELYIFDHISLCLEHDSDE